MQSTESLFQSLLSVTAILFGLFGIFLTGYETTRSRVGKRWVAYVILAFFLGASVLIGSVASLMAFLGLTAKAQLFGFCSEAFVTIANWMLELLIIIEILAVPIFGLVYLWARRE